MSVKTGEAQPEERVKHGAAYFGRGERDANVCGDAGETGGTVPVGGQEREADPGQVEKRSVVGKFPVRYPLAYLRPGSVGEVGGRRGDLRPGG